MKLILLFIGATFLFIQNASADNCAFSASYLKKSTLAKICKRYERKDCESFSKYNISKWRSSYKECMNVHNPSRQCIACELITNPKKQRTRRALSYKSWKKMREKRSGGLFNGFWRADASSAGNIRGSKKPRSGFMFSPIVRD